MIFVCFEVVMIVNGSIGGFWLWRRALTDQMATSKCPMCVPNYTALEYINFDIIQFVEYPSLSSKRSSALGVLFSPFFMYAYYKI